MPHPSSSTTLNRPDLGQAAYEYYLGMDQEGFIADQVLPEFGVPRQSSTYPKIPKEVFLRVADGRRDAEGNYQRDDWEFENDYYATQEYGFESPVDDRIANLYSDYFDAEMITTNRLAKKLKRAREKRVADMVFNTSNVPAYGSNVTQWSTVASATPITDIEAVKLSLWNTYGIEANAVIFNKTNLSYLRRNAQIQNALTYTDPVQRMPGQQFVRLLAELFDVPNVLVGKSLYDSSKKNKTPSLSGLWSTTYCFVGRIATSSDFADPALGLTFRWTQESPSMLVTEQYREDKVRGDIYRVRQEVHEKIINTEAGFLVDVANN